MARNALTRYEGPGEISFNNKPLAEATSCTVSIAPGSTPVNTMKKGLAGRSRGPVACTVRIESAIPKAGLEAEFFDLCVDDADCTVTILIGGKRRSIDGWLTGVESTQGTGAAASVSCTLMGGKPRKQ